MGQVVFNIGDSEDVLPHHASRPSAEAGARGDDELDVLEWDAGQGEGLDRRGVGIGVPTDPDNPKAEGEPLFRQVLFRDRRGGQGAEEGSAVDHQGDIGPIDLGRRHRFRVFHGHRHRHNLDDLALRQRPTTDTRCDTRQARSPSLTPHGRVIPPDE